MDPSRPDRVPAPIPQIVDELIALQQGRQQVSAFKAFGNRLSAEQYTPVYEAARKYVPAGSTVLDWGCGAGHFSYFLLRSQCQVTGFSFEPHPEFLRLRDHFEFVPGAPAEPSLLPFPDESFDAVFSIGVLEHVRETAGDELTSLREIRRVLKADGLFVCAHLPNQRTWIEFLVRTMAPSVIHHRFRFRKRDILALWAKADLPILSIRRYAWLPRNPLSELASLGNGRVAIVCYAVAAAVAKLLLYPFHQNFLVVARKPT